MSDEKLEEKVLRGAVYLKNVKANPVGGYEYDGSGTVTIKDKTAIINYGGPIKIISLDNYNIKVN